MSTSYPTECSQHDPPGDADVDTAREAAGHAPPLHSDPAWERFYEDHDPLIRRIVHRSRLPFPDQEDCVQDAWLAILAHPPVPQGHGASMKSFAWVVTIARNKVRDRARDRDRQHLSDDGHLSLPLVLGRAVDPRHSCERAEECEWLRELMHQLEGCASRLNLEILRLRSVEGLAVSVVATRLGLPPEQIRYRHHRTIRKLRRLVQAAASGLALHCSPEEIHPS
jgi:RNA polymerase sigma factor (sigma-70 family)